MSREFRKHIRLESYDYSSNGFYFITICCDYFKPLFGRIENDLMVMNSLGKVAQAQWLDLENRYSQIKCHAYQIMPNHMHGILEIYNSGSEVLHLSRIIGAYKSLTHKHAREMFKEKRLGKVWQPNFYEHVIRNEKAYQIITEYIETNPSQWKKDKYFIE